VVLFYFARPNARVYGVGFCLILLGGGVRIWAAGHLSKNREVTTTGPYAYVKNPLYLGTFLNLIGFCVAARQVVILAVGLAIFLLYYAPFKKRRESDRLREIFGAVWDDYNRSVPDYLPRMTPYAGRGTHAWAWSRVLDNSEHQTAAVTLCGLAFLGMRLFT